MQAASQTPSTVYGNALGLLCEAADSSLLPPFRKQTIQTVVINDIFDRASVSIQGENEAQSRACPVYVQLLSRKTSTQSLELRARIRQLRLSGQLSQRTMDTFLLDRSQRTERNFSPAMYMQLHALALSLNRVGDRRVHISYVCIRN